MSSIGARAVSTAPQHQRYMGAVQAAKGPTDLKNVKAELDDQYVQAERSSLVEYGFFMRGPNLPSFRNVLWPTRLLVATAGESRLWRLFLAFKTKRSTRSKIALIFQALPYCSSANRFLCSELMRARTRGFLSWFNRSPASCATCRGTSVAPRLLALTHLHRHKSPCALSTIAIGP
jgi:hypothetical protein